MNNLSSLIELRCSTCNVGLGIAELRLVQQLRTRAVSAHLGHGFKEIPFVSVTDDGQVVARMIVRRQGGLMVYKSDVSS